MYKTRHDLLQFNIILSYVEYKVACIILNI
jgi:hypothetical protein